jgi:hypothetical protein
MYLKEALMAIGVTMVIMAVIGYWLFEREGI